MSAELTVRPVLAGQVEEGERIVVADRWGVDTILVREVLTCDTKVTFCGPNQDGQYSDFTTEVDEQVLVARRQSLSASREVTWAILGLLPAGSRVSDADGTEWECEDDPVLGPVWVSRALRQTVSDPVLALRGPLTVTQVPATQAGGDQA